MTLSDDRRPSLKRRLLLTLLLPLCGVLLAGGAWGAWFVHRVVENVNDRVLSGSLQAIAETLSMQEGYLTLDLPPSALGMLENPDRDNVYYSITYQGRLVTGYSELSAPKGTIRLEDIEFRDSTFHGVPIRVASQAKLVPQLDSPVIIQVAETVNNRTALADRMLTGLMVMEILLLAMIGALVLMAVDWGLKPLSVLRKEVEERNNQPEIDFAPLHLSAVPQEALPFVSAFNSLLGHVETAFETLRRFTSDASHQLRAPLAVVRTHVELLGRRTDGSEEMRDTVADLRQAVQALQHLIVQLISLAKAERPRSDEESGMASFDLVECATATARNYATLALERYMDLSFEASCETLLVRGNSIFAGEMIANLLENAIRYGHRGGHISARISAARLSLEIEDDGPGIPAKDRERVFERFYRLPQNINTEGSGLGLSIVQALGRRMGASVTLETPDSGQGLLVIVQFQQASGEPEPSLDFAARLAPAPHKLRTNETV